MIVFPQVEAFPTIEATVELEVMVELEELVEFWAYARAKKRTTKAILKVREDVLSVSGIAMQSTRAQLLPPARGGSQHMLLGAHGAPLLVVG
jgi:hypothetical protein